MSGSALALPRTVRDLVEEYQTKDAAIEDAIQAFDAAFDQLGMAATVQGAFVAPVGSKSYLHARDLQKNLLASGWKAIYGRLQIDRIASAKDKQLFERTIADPPPLTVENARATFGDYFERPRFHILRGLAEAFADLDPAYKSHAKVRIGVKGLPKRVILNGWGEYGSGYARDKFRDMMNALAAYQGKPAWEHVEMLACNIAHSLGEDAILDGRTYVQPARRVWEKPEHRATVDRGTTVRKFGNGNAHVFFDKWTLLDINRALAEFYGEVLPDAPEGEAAKRPGTAVAKDLQFYWSPPAVIAKALELAGVHGSDQYGHGRERPCYRVLEPSCGDGRILDEIRARGHRALGIEFDGGRAAESRAKGHSVLTANFLDQQPTPEFDKVVMNPPFYGRHYVKHVQHALRFLKPGGTLVSILPATAHYDHGELEGEWRDLPVASFADAGTNVPTGLLKMRNPAA
jgi:SAM-dependent methyltransferase